MEYISTKEAAEVWQTSEQMIRRYCREGRIPNAIQRDGFWLVPIEAETPTNKRRETPSIPPLVKQLMKEKTKRVYHGMYDYIQVNFCYSSNRMASNRLMRQQVEDIYKTGKVKVGFEPIKVDEVISQILCKRQMAVQNRAKYFQGVSGGSCCRLAYKIARLRGHVKGGGVSLRSSRPLTCRAAAG